ncbi:MAG: carbon-nitrogen hydrolase family protein, partial [Candidatus Hydrogenedentes bacterium]|nr:carbon-nitrogen hydrolase family protein [Candidatus Hydrogenedentota bacterium]
MRNHCGGDEGKRKNLERMCRCIEQAQREGVQLLAFPEMSLQGYFTPVSGSVEEAVQANHALADVVGESGYLKSLQEAAARANIVLVFGFAEKAGDQIFNSAGVINADGRWLGVRRKNPLYPWPYELESFAEPPKAARSTVFDTAVGRIGVSVCFDGEFGESVRQMRIDGAELLVWINAACGDSTLGTAQRLNAAGTH